MNDDTGLPIDLMLRDADEAWRLFEFSPTTLSGLLGDLACHVRALADALDRRDRAAVTAGGTAGQAERPGGWIGVDEAMPMARPRILGAPRSEDVLVLIAGRRRVGRYLAPRRTMIGTWDTDGVFREDADVTHWQPLPPPPPETNRSQP